MIRTATPIFLPLRRAGTDLLVDHLLKSICHEKRRFSYI
jgi:hypothetical protein